MNASPIPRPTARILVLDPEDNLLLINASEGEYRGSGAPVWITPGGGLNDGETHEDAAIRELWEETGLHADAGTLQCVWTRSHVFEFRRSLIEQQERYYLLPCEASPCISYDNWEAEEREDLKEHRWWSADEIEASAETFAPRRLGVLLRGLLRDGPPEAPFDVAL